MFEFILFAILGWVVFAPAPVGQGRIVLLVVFVVLMMIWLLQGVGAFTIPYGGGRWH
jgi:hypothetical protein